MNEQLVEKLQKILALSTNQEMEQYRTRKSQPNRKKFDVYSADQGRETGRRIKLNQMGATNTASLT